eukprot:6072095-Alexandrium_andersonii.AAC.1
MGGWRKALEAVGDPGEGGGCMYGSASVVPVLPTPQECPRWPAPAGEPSPAPTAAVTAKPAAAETGPAAV